MPTVVLRYHETVRSVETDPYETVYQAAARSGAPVLTDCLEGACATCKARCVEGEYDLIDPSFDALSSEEEQAGFVLLCQMEPRGPCVVEMPYTLAFAQNSHPGMLSCEVGEIASVGSSIVRLRVESPTPLDFVPGQYAQVLVPGTDVRRAYSFANSPGAHTAEFYVRLLEDGAMGAYLRRRARVGDELQLELPFGGFYLRAGTGPLVAITGGTGLAPILSMLAELAARGSRRNVHVIHGARAPEALFGLEALEAFNASGLSVQLHLAVERDAAPGMFTGQVTDIVTSDLIGSPGADVYLCGPPSMVASAEAKLAMHGVPAARVFVERFNPA